MLSFGRQEEDESFSIENWLDYDSEEVVIGFHLGGLETDIEGSDSVWAADSIPSPEPATMLLVGSGLIGLAVFSRKFRKR